MSYVEPALPLFLLIAAGGLIALWRRFGWSPGLAFACTGIAAIFLLSSPWFAVLLAVPLEIWYDEDNALPKGAAEVIVVLSGSVDPPHPGRPYPAVGQDTYRRLQHAVWLYKYWKQLPILVCGGPAGENGEPHATEMRRILEAEGIAPEKIFSESRSRSTHENALFGAEVLRMRKLSRVALVVEANSMLRASLSFEKQGISVVPAAVRFTTLMRSWRDLLPDWRPIARNGETVHELAGLLWYRWRGWI
jgi:uncharacterized SAM-binding protein YcdF (DUF218 family)